MESFCKTRSCPSSETILSFQTGEMDPAGSASVRRHLFECEFCDAEAGFYALYPPGELTAVDRDEIPDPLFELATDLLQRKRDLAPLYRLVGQS
jgi:hypothetical protein